MISVKVWPEEQELPHAILGMELAKKYKEHADVCNAVGAHHDEIEMTTLDLACDSGLRCYFRLKARGS